MEESNVLSSTYHEESIKAVEALRRGLVILYPTDSIWGLGCDIENRSAVERIYEIKERDKSQPFVLLVSSIEMLKKYVAKIHPRIETLLVYHTLPLTIIYDKPKNLPDYLLSDQGTVAIRVCDEPFCQSVIEKFGKPIVSTSANKSGIAFPVNFKSIEKYILQESDHIVNYRQEEETENVPSILARYNHKGELEFLRN